MSELTPLMSFYKKKYIHNSFNNLYTPACLAEFIKTLLPKSNQPLSEAANHHFENPGKMLRAGLAISSGKALNASTEASAYWAAAIELLHNASLVHDDISDGDTMRRGRSSVWAAYGSDTALAFGDWLIALSFEMAAHAATIGNTPRLVQVMARHMKDTTLGQAMEFELTGYPDWNTYTMITRGKTAPLFIAPVEGIALLAGRNDLVTPVSRYFNSVGMAYQLANDILNMIGDDGALNPAHDLLRRAPNGVIVTFREQLAIRDAGDFAKWLLSGDHSSGAIWHGRIMSSRAIPDSIRIMNDILREAGERAGNFPPELGLIVEPVQALLEKICARSVKHAAE